MSEPEMIERYREALAAIGEGTTVRPKTATVYDHRATLGSIGDEFARACRRQPGLDPIRAVAGPGSVVVRVGTAVLVNLDRPTPGQLAVRVLAAARSALGASDGFNLVVFGRRQIGLA